jgi:hypothetical protein
LGAGFLLLATGADLLGDLLEAIFRLTPAVTLTVGVFFFAAAFLRTFAACADCGAIPVFTAIFPSVVPMALAAVVNR